MPVKTTQSGVNETSAKKIRRRAVIARLEAQLKRGNKTTTDMEVFDGKKGYFISGLSDKDITRIKKELEVLKSRV